MVGSDDWVSAVIGPGFHQAITRRDFVNVAGIGLAASAFLGCDSRGRESDDSMASDPWSDALGPEWYGPGGIGDYAISHGNTPEVVRAAHRLRDARQPSLADAIETGEHFDVVIVGGGLAGLSAAHSFKTIYPSGRCLVLENHPVFGGEAKRNELEIDGVRLMGPQGSNGFGITAPTGGADDYFTALGIPREFEYAPWEGDIRVPQDNYGFMHWVQDRYSVGHFFRREDGDRWVQSLWDDPLRAPWSTELRDGFAKWRTATLQGHQPQDMSQEDLSWLDRITLKDYYENLLGLPAEVTKYVDPILASIIGLGCDAVSAWWGYHFGLPGFELSSRYDDFTFHSFPGGNTGIARYFVKNLVSDAIEGGLGLGDVVGGQIDFSTLDREGETVRIRLGASVIDVRHSGSIDASERVRVTYVHEDKAYVVEASGVVMASGGWVNSYVMADLPKTHRTAYETFRHAPILVANVGLRNWRFLERLGIAACMYEGDLGFSCNIRRPMYAGNYRPPFGPDHPSMLTFYITFEQPGLSPEEQGILGRTELLSTPFSEYERRLREQMLTLFGDAGFNPTEDIGGLVLNRWGHAYIAPGPGFFFAQDGNPAPPDVIRDSVGRISIGHSELQGHQNVTGAVAEGRRALEQVLDQF